MSKIVIGIVGVLGLILLIGGAVVLGINHGIIKNKIKEVIIQNFTIANK